MCEAGCLAGYAREPCTRDCKVRSQTEDFWNHLVVVQSEGTMSCV
jgi:hypothetical protein